MSYTKPPVTATTSVDGLMPAASVTALASNTTQIAAHGTTLATHTGQIANRTRRSILDDGAVVGAGVDNHAAIALTLAAVALAGGGEAYVPPGTYGCASQIVLPSGVALVGAGREISVLDFTLYGTNTAACVAATGTYSSTVAIQNNVARGDLSLHIPSHGIAAGDYFVLGSAEGFRGATTSGVFAHKGELCTAYAVPDADHITLLAPTFDSYTAATSGVIRKVTMATDVGIEGLSILRAYNTTTDAFGVQFQLCDRVRVTECKVKNTTYTAVWIDACRDVRVSGNSIVDCWRDGTNNGLSYGISVDNASLDVRIEGNYLRKFRHGIKVGKGAIEGVPRKIAVIGNTLEKTAQTEQIVAALDCHLSAEYVDFIANIITVPQGCPGIGIQGYNCSAVANQMYGGGIQVGSATDNEWSSNHSVDTAVNCAVVDNMIVAVGGDSSTYGGIAINADGGIVEGNLIDMRSAVGGSASGIFVGATSTRQIADTLICGNRVLGGPASSIDVRAVARCRVDNNMLTPTSATGYGVFVGDRNGLGCTTVDVDNNTIADLAGNVAAGIYFNTSVGHTDIGYANNTINLTAAPNFPVLISGTVAFGTRRYGAITVDTKISFGVGGPTISTGTAVPSAAEPDGSFYMRSGTPNGALYVRANSAWVAK